MPELVNYTRVKMKTDIPEEPFSKEWYRKQEWQMEYAYPEGTENNYEYYICKIFDSVDFIEKGKLCFPSNATLLFIPKNKTLSLTFPTDRDCYLSGDYATFAFDCESLEEAEKIRLMLHK